MLAREPKVSLGQPWKWSRAGILFPALLAILVSCTPVPDSNRAVIPDREDVVTATVQISQDIVLAASVETYVSHLDGGAALLKTHFINESGGVFCGGAVAYTIESWSAEGWNVGSISYGVEGQWTRMVAVVETEDGWIIADPYLGNVWLEDLEESVEIIRAGGHPPVQNFGVDRKVVFPGPPPNRASSFWVLGRDTAFPLECTAVGDNSACSVTHDYLDYEERYHLPSDFVDTLASYGLAPTINSGLVLPYGINVPGRGWVDVDDIESAVETLNQASVTGINK